MAPARCLLRRFVLLSALLLSGTVAAQPSEAVALIYDEGSPPAAFAAAEITDALEARGIDVLPPDAQPARRRIVLTLAPDTTTLPPEGFQIRVAREADDTTVRVLGGDEAGVLYGGLEVAELIRIGGPERIRDDRQAPYMAMRGTKFNIPLDVRTPSYSDVSDAAQQNIAEMWSLDFWRAYIDHLARRRYNFVSLWSLHPFPSMVRVPEYPDVALDDVQRSTAAWKEYYALQGKGFDAPEIVEHVETLRRMTIDEKIAFWREVMRYGKTRNVEFYVVTWNVFVNGTEGKYGITDDLDNPVTADYFRRSVRELFLTYPDLRGVGLTTGENMPGASFAEKEDWAFRTYGQGVLDVVERQPGRKIRFIHRQHQAGADVIAERFAPLVAHPDIDFIFSFKYAQAHAMSSTRQTFHEAFLGDLDTLKTIWTLRNDDNYLFRWSAPDFVRAFLHNIPYDVSQGFYYGSDQYIWGREFLSLDPETPRRLEVDKHWLHWTLWGRLGYDPGLSNDRFAALIGARFPGVDADRLFAAWQHASMIYPLTTGFHWGALDFQWYIEGCRSRPGPADTPSGFHDVNRFISLGPHPGTDNVSIPRYVRALQEGRTVEGTSPVEVSTRLHARADSALALLSTLSSDGDDELRRTLADIEAMALLGKYYAHKIHGATDLALFRATGEHPHRERAVDALNAAAGYWGRYASNVLARYQNGFWTNRVGYVDFVEAMDHALYDVTIAGGTPDPPPVAPHPGGRLLEAEAGGVDAARVQTTTSGYTGTGYVRPRDHLKPDTLAWTFEAPEAGAYVADLRYIAGEARDARAHLEVNGRPAGAFHLLQSGGGDNWAPARRVVRLNEGQNEIVLLAAGVLRIDHLNVVRE